MGIKCLTKFIFTNCKNCISYVEYSHYKNRRIAIDGNIYFYKLYHQTFRKISKYRDLSLHEYTDEDIELELLNQISLFFSEFFKNKIFPLFFMDGNDKSENITSSSRKLKKREAENKYSKLRKISQTRMLTREEKKRLDFLYLQKFTMTRKNYLIFQMIMKILLIPIYKTRIEAEQICSILCIEKFVSAVLSEDSDVLAHGCPETIRFCSRENKFQRIKLDDVLKETSTTFNQFLDACILCGCDYNNIQTDPKTAFELVLDESYRETMNRESINYEKCMEIFKFQPSEKFIYTNIHILPNKKICKNISKLSNKYKTIELNKFIKALKSY